MDLLTEVKAIQSTQERLFQLMFGKLTLSKLEVKQILELADLKAAEALKKGFKRNFQKMKKCFSPLNSFQLQVFAKA